MQLSHKSNSMEISNQKQTVLTIKNLLSTQAYTEAKKMVDRYYVELVHNPEFLEVAAEAYRFNQDFESEAESLRKLIQSSRSVEYLVSYSESLVQLADYPAALKILHEALDQAEDEHPCLFNIYKNMGNIYLKCGDIDAAEEKYNLAFSINSQDESILVNYGVLSIQKNNFDEAKQRFSEVVGKNSTSDLAWVGLALVHRAFSDNELARACLLRALDENIYNKLAIANYYSWCDADGVDAASIFVDQFLDQFPEDKEISQLRIGMSQ